MNETVQEFGRIDILVNNASMQVEHPPAHASPWHLHTLDAPLLLQGDAVEDFTQIERSRLEKTFLVNIVGMISLAQKAVLHMQPGSAIINVRTVPSHLFHRAGASCAQCADPLSCNQSCRWLPSWHMTPSLASWTTPAPRCACAA